MSLVTKENVKKGLAIFACHDDRPIDGYGYAKGIITEVYEDHYLYHDLDLDLPDVWGFYETDLKRDTIANFTTEKEAKKWLGIES